MGPFRRKRTRTVRVREATLGGLLDAAHCVGRLSGHPRLAPEEITADNAGHILDALRATVDAVPLSAFASEDALVQTARAAYAAWLAAVQAAEFDAGKTVEQVEEACGAWLGKSGGESSGLERALGAMPPSDALALWDAPLSVSLRLLGWGAVHGKLRAEIEGAAQRN